MPARACRRDRYPRPPGRAAGPLAARQARGKTRRHEVHEGRTFELAFLLILPLCVLGVLPVSNIRPHPAIRRVAPPAALAEVLLLELAERVGREGLAMGGDIDAIDLGRVQAEDFRLVLLGQLLIAELLAQLVGNLEALEGFDDPLR